MRARHPGRDGGFTLVEMLVSLALLSMAAVMMFQGLGSGQRLWAGEAARVGRGETIEAAQTALRTRLERLSPVTRVAGDATFADIQGDEREMTFIAPPPESERPAAARRYRLTLDSHGALLLGAAEGGLAAQDAPVYRDQVMLLDIGDLNISYYGPGPDGGAAQWWSDWKQRITPPQLVRIRADMRAGDQRVWPELVVQPAATVDTLCSIDAATGACRGRG